MTAFFRMAVLTAAAVFLISTVVAVHPTSAQNWPMVNGNKERTSYVDDQNFQPPLRVAASGVLSEVYINPFSYYDGVLYGAREGEPNTAVAVNATTGDVLWTFEIPETRASMNHVPAVDANVVLCGGQQAGGLFALDRITGTEKWSIPMAPLYARNALIDDGLAYVMTDTIFCIDLSNGMVLWTYDIGTTGNSTITMDDQAVYANIGRRLFAVDRQNGTELWSIESYERSYGQVMVGTDTLYASNNGAVRAIDASDGSIIWETELPQIDVTAGLSAGNMALAPDLVCHIAWKDTSGVAAMYALDRSTGTPRWTHLFTGEGVYTPVIVGNHVYVTEWEKYIIWGLHLSDGSTAWSMQLSKLAQQPVFADGKLYVADMVDVVVLEPGVAGIGEIVPQRTALSMQVAPNPVVDQLHIQLSLSQRSSVRISLHDMLGRDVAMISESVIDAGTTAFSWSLASAGLHRLSPGMYMLHAQTSGQSVSRKVMILGR